MAVNDFKQYTVSMLDENDMETKVCPGDIIDPIVLVLDAVLNGDRPDKLKIQCDIKRRMTAEMWVSRIEKYISSNAAVLVKQVQTKIDCVMLCKILFDTSVNSGITYEKTKDSLSILIEFSDDIIKQIKQNVVL